MFLTFLHEGSAQVVPTSAAAASDPDSAAFGSSSTRSAAALEKQRPSVSDCVGMRVRAIVNAELSRRVRGEALLLRRLADENASPPHVTGGSSFAAHAAPGAALRAAITATVGASLTRRAHVVSV